MQVKVTRNSKPVGAVESIELAGDVATVVAAEGSELDGLLYYNATRDGRPRLGLYLDKEGEDGKQMVVDQRFIVESLGSATYKLHARLEIPQ